MGLIFKFYKKSFEKSLYENWEVLNGMFVIFLFYIYFLKIIKNGVKLCIIFSFFIFVYWLELRLFFKIVGW